MRAEIALLIDMIYKALMQNEPEMIYKVLIQNESEDFTTSLLGRAVKSTLDAHTLISQ